MEPWICFSSTIWGRLLVIWVRKGCGGCCWSHLSKTAGLGLSEPDQGLLWLLLTLLVLASWTKWKPTHPPSNQCQPFKWFYQAMDFPVAMWDVRILTFHVIRMWELDHKEGRALKNWCFWTLMLEKTLESPLEKKEIRPVNPKGNQPWIFGGKTDNWSWNSNMLAIWCWLIGKDPDAGKDWRQEKETTEDEMVGWHHLFNRHECEQILGDTEGQGSLVCCRPWGGKESDTTEWLNNNTRLSMYVT